MKLGIDILRHFLTIFVILQHMTSSRYSVDVNAEISSYVDFIDGAVAGFFIISGYFSKKQTDLLKFTRLLAIRLLVPFFIFSVTYTLILFALDKSSLSDGLYKTITLHGAGMQLYFLPYLLVVSFSFAIIRYITSEKDTIRNFGILMIILVLFCILIPTPVSTGNNLKLLPFYFLAYISGFLYQRIKSNIYTISFSILFLILGQYDPRFLDLSFMMILFCIAESLSDNLGQKRAKGSGGVYLFHTPIVNFTISILLTKLGIVQLQNVFVSVALTYVFCLAVSIVFMKVLPKYRWIILE